MLAHSVFGLGDFDVDVYFFVKCNFKLLFLLDFRDLSEISRGEGWGWKMGEGHNFSSPWKGRVMKN